MVVASWLVVAGLGAWHGLNPAMGWLFAVALAMQAGDRMAAWRALIPLAAGHFLAVAAAIGGAALLGAVLDLAAVGMLAGAALVGFGIWKLWRARHPRFGGMRAGAGDLVIWSFLMASAHGAGLMVVPFTLGESAAPGHHHQLATAGPAVPLGPALLHTATYLLTIGVVAWLVATRIGVAPLRRWWLNLDLVWSVALVATGVASLLGWSRYLP